MKHSFTVPTRFAGRPVYYQILPQEGKKWAWGSPQALLYANGEALQGFDSNHTRTRLLDCAPVSYTHLDVYKRQDFDSVIRWFESSHPSHNCGVQFAHRSFFQTAACVA